MNNIMYGCARAYNAIHQSHVLVNVRFSLINTFAGMQSSKCKSFAQTLTLLLRGRVWEPDYYGLSDLLVGHKL